MSVVSDRERIVSSVLCNSLASREFSKSKISKIGVKKPHEECLLRTVLFVFCKLQGPGAQGGCCSTRGRGEKTSRD